MNFEAETKIKARKGNDKVKYEQQLEGKRDEFWGRNQDKGQEGEQQRPNPHLTTKATSGVLYRKKEGEAMNADSLLLTDRVFKWLADHYLEIMSKAKGVHKFTLEK